MTEEFNEMDMERSQALNVEIKEEPKKFLTFLSDGLTFAIDATNVGEIITNYSITIVPNVPSFIKGIINLRGQIIPIIDIRERMHKMPGLYREEPLREGQTSLRAGQFRVEGGVCQPYPATSRD